MLLDFSSRPGAALVVGATGGIGSAVAHRLAAAGSALALTYRTDAATADALITALPGEPHAWALDLTDAAATARVVAAAAERYGGLHTVVYAAGPHVPMIHLSRVTPEQFRDQLTADAVGFFTLVSAVLPALRESRGSLVAVTTAATRRYPVRDGLSAGPKGAIEALVRGIAAEEGRFGVRANCVGPGMTTDGMAVRLIANGDLDDAALDAARNNIPLGRFGTADDVAAAVTFLASEQARYITGQKLDVDGGYGV
ncbi:SDR family NAD(P)-dependent oxidoreductase [Virgisporangium aurantiacum]|uniref:Short-chain dehydrogenase n=1 Tax=Virgisporangium aurantiacum TaxID=175570 RepID=A0A8J3YZ21_9ACTN|nr:SDR family oxidoreductase [Virgisporangium aurantiacum]GIJ54634.1 short-chain dehydrogenase [Virgisporangium aurantiacum]